MNKKKTSVIGLLAVLAIFTYLFWPDRQPEVVQVQRSAYPAIWKQVNLPNLAGGVVTEVINRGDLEEGIEIELDVNQSVEDLGQFFEQELDDREYDSYEPEEEEEHYANEFSSGNTDISIDVRNNPATPGSSRVRIVIKQAPRIQTPANQTSLRMD